ncbi:hypothetical protein LBMAG42_21220 [Deltaproteobacteria bacterium]|nr:hypothetical protein LBMAG42_21220 [Deltaproteobacteria bacterium]
MLIASVKRLVEWGGGFPMSRAQQSTSVQETPRSPTPQPPSAGADPLGNQARLAGARLQREAPEPQERVAVTGPEAGEAGVCEAVVGIDADRRGRLEALGAQVRAALAPWATQRTTANLRFDVGELNEAMRAFRENWRVAYGALPDPREVRQVLDEGTTRSAIAELLAFEAGLDWGYAHGLQIARGEWPTHKYTLTPRASVTIGAAAVGRLVACTLRYENDHGMGWEREGCLTMLGARAALGYRHGTGGTGGPTTASALGIELAGAGQPILSQPARAYFSAEDFGSALAYEVNAEAAVDASVSVGGVAGAEGVALSAHGISLQAGGRALDFLTTGVGRTEAASAALSGPAPTGVSGGAQLGLGATLGTVTGEQTPTVVGHANPLAEAPRREDPELLVTAMLHFGTGEARLDGDDLATLQDVIHEMYRVDERFEGALYTMHLMGWASRRWRGARTPEEALTRNLALAERRVATVRRNLVALLADPGVQFTEG